MSHVYTRSFFSSHLRLSHTALRSSFYKTSAHAILSCALNATSFREIVFWRWRHPKMAVPVLDGFFIVPIVPDTPLFVIPVYAAISRPFYAVPLRIIDFTPLDSNTFQGTNFTTMVERNAFFSIRFAITTAFGRGIIHSTN